MRLLVVALLVLSACTSRTPDEVAVVPSKTDAPPAPPEDTKATRAEAAGLDEGQAAALDTLGVTVYVPVLPEGWRLLEALTDTLTEDGVFYPSYTLRYRTSQGTCLDLLAASEGLGDVFLSEPPHERDVRVSGVTTTGPVHLGWGIAGETDEGWEDGRVATEWFGTDGLYLSVQSSDADECRPASPEAAEALLSTLRPLDPAGDAVFIGPVEIVESESPDAQTPFLSSDSLETVARRLFGATERGEGNAETTVETLRLRPRFAVVLVTNTNLSDDSVRDERTRVVFTRGDAGWTVTTAGRQVRCRAGRGHTGWSDEACV